MIKNKINDLNVFTEYVIIGDFSKAKHIFYSSVFKESISKVYYDKFIRICSIYDKPDLIKDFYLTLSLHYLEKEEFTKVIDSASRCIDTYRKFAKKDFYTYDPSVNSICKMISNRIACNVNNRTDNRVGIVYQICHTHHSNYPAIIHALDLTLFKFHNRSIFQVYAVVTDKPNATNNNFEKLKSRLHKRGITIVDSSKEDPYEYVTDIVQKTAELNIKILIATCLDNSSSLIFTYAVRNTKKISIIFGTPSVHTNEDFDLAITPHKMALKYLPCEGKYINTSTSSLIENPVSKSIHSRISNKILSRFVILIYGRTEKVISKPILNLFTRLLNNNKKINIRILGANPTDVKARLTHLSKTQLNRVEIFDRSIDYFSRLKACDLAIDTFPNGGAQSIFDIVSLSIPIITFSNKPNFFISFNEYSFSNSLTLPKELIFSSPSSRKIVPFINKLSKDRELCYELGKKCFKLLSKQTRNATDIVKQYEKEYLRLLDMN